MSVEEHIRRAMQEGKFDNLPGQGKPLHLDENPYEDPEWRLAHHMLRSSGYTLPWIELRSEIEAEEAAAAADLVRTWTWRQQAMRQQAGQSGVDLAQVEVEWRRALAIFQERVEALNRKIFTYNLQVPSPQFALLRRNPEKMIQQLCTPAQME